MQIDGPAAWHDTIQVDIALTDTQVTYRLLLRNGVLTHTAAASHTPADVTITVPSTGLFAALTAADPASAGAELTGDLDALRRLTSYIDPPDPDFAIVTP